VPIKEKMNKQGNTNDPPGKRKNKRGIAKVVSKGSGRPARNGAKAIQDILDDIEVADTETHAAFQADLYEEYAEEAEDGEDEYAAPSSVSDVEDDDESDFEVPLDSPPRTRGRKRKIST